MLEEDLMLSESDSDFDEESVILSDGEHTPDLSGCEWEEVDEESEENEENAEIERREDEESAEEERQEEEEDDDDCIIIEDDDSVGKGETEENAENAEKERRQDVVESEDDDVLIIEDGECEKSGESADSGDEKEHKEERGADSQSDGERRGVDEQSDDDIQEVHEEYAEDTVEAEADDQGKEEGDLGESGRQSIHEEELMLEDDTEEGECQETGEVADTEGGIEQGDGRGSDRGEETLEEQREIRGLENKRSEETAGYVDVETATENHDPEDWWMDSVGDAESQSRWPVRSVIIDSSDDDEPERETRTKGVQVSTCPCARNPLYKRLENEEPSTSQYCCVEGCEERRIILTDRLRKLLIGSRKQIRGLKSTVANLEKQLESSGIVTCPNCELVFKERKNRLMPKYMRVLRGKLTVEVEFSSMDHMREWMILNGLDTNTDGMPSIVDIDDKTMNLRDVGSFLPEFAIKLTREAFRREALLKREAEKATGSGVCSTGTVPPGGVKGDLMESWKSVVRSVSTDIPEESAIQTSRPGTSAKTSTKKISEPGKRKTPVKSPVVDQNTRYSIRNRTVNVPAAKVPELPERKDGKPSDLRDQNGKVDHRRKLVSTMRDTVTTSGTAKVPTMDSRKQDTIPSERVPLSIPTNDIIPETSKLVVQPGSNPPRRSPRKRNQGKKIEPLNLKLTEAGWKPFKSPVGKDRELSGNVRDPTDVDIAVGSRFGGNMDSKDQRVPAMELQPELLPESNGTLPGKPPGARGKGKGGKLAMNSFSGDPKQRGNVNGNRQETNRNSREPSGPPGNERPGMLDVPNVEAVQDNRRMGGGGERTADRESREMEKKGGMRKEQELIGRHPSRKRQLERSEDDLSSRERREPVKMPRIARKEAGEPVDRSLPASRESSPEEGALPDSPPTTPAANQQRGVGEMKRESDCRPPPKWTPMVRNKVPPTETRQTLPPEPLRTLQRPPSGARKEWMERREERREENRGEGERRREMERGENKWRERRRESPPRPAVVPHRGGQRRSPPRGTKPPPRDYRGTQPTPRDQREPRYTSRDPPSTPREPQPTHRGYREPQPAPREPHPVSREPHAIPREPRPLPREPGPVPREPHLVPRDHRRRPPERNRHR